MSDPSNSSGKRIVEWHAALLNRSATIEQAIQSLNATALQIVLVVDENRNLVGTITDGDVRRGLLRGLSLSDHIEPIVLKNPLVVTPEVTGDLIVQLMRANRVHQLPVVDEQGRPVGLHLWDEITAPTKRANTMVIMAGGLGTRMQPHTATCPKPMLPVAGKPMLEHIIERSRRDGFHNFVLAIRYLGEMIVDYFGDGSKFGISIRYLKEEKPLGTAGALSLLSPEPTEPIVVTNGDVLADISYGDFLDYHVRNNAVATMAVRQYEWQHPYGVVESRGVEIIGFEEKPVYRSHVNAGIYALSPNSLRKLVKDQACDMPALFKALGSDGARTIVYPMHEPWLDVGRPSDYAQAAQTMANKAS